MSETILTFIGCMICYFMLIYLFFLIIVVCHVTLSDFKKAIDKSKSDEVNEDGLLYSNTFILAWNI